MQYELNQVVRNTISGEQGVIRGRAEYIEDYGKPTYWVVFKDAQGRAASDWWRQNEFKPVDTQAEKSEASQTPALDKALEDSGTSRWFASPMDLVPHFLEIGKRMRAEASSSDSKRARLIHIIGPQGSGKTLLAEARLELHRAQGRVTPSHPIDCGDQWNEDRAAHYRELTIRRREAYSRSVTFQPCDVVVICHQREPVNLALQPGDEVIRLEVAHG